MISENELNRLKSFHGNGNYALTVYLRLDTPQFRETAYEHFDQAVQACLERCASQPECREAIREDLEIVGLYIKTNVHRHYPGVAIFSCAAELFWRAYPLPAPIPTQVSVGSGFNVEPLLELFVPSRAALPLSEVSGTEH
ncbi:MAG: hypothetical protein ACUVWZ_04580 [Anaerolineae bacterium]